MPHMGGAVKQWISHYLLDTAQKRVLKKGLRRRERETEVAAPRLFFCTLQKPVDTPIQMCYSAVRVTAGLLEPFNRRQVA